MHVGWWFYTGRWTFTRVSPEQLCKYWEKHVATAVFFLTNWKLLNNCCRNFLPAVVNWKDHKNQRKDKYIEKYYFCLVQNILGSDKYHLFWKSAVHSNVNFPWIQKLVTAILWAAAHKKRVIRIHFNDRY